MRARRNSPSLDTMSPYMRNVIGKPPIAPRGAAQAEMPGMETDAAAVVLMTEKRRADKKAEKPSKEDLFDFQLRSMMLPKFERQVMFAKSIGRRWMLDFACAAYMLAVEIEGLVVMRVNGELIVKGRHASISGFKEDCEKYASAAVLGWTVIRFEQSQVKDGTAIAMTQRVLCAKGWKP